MAAAPVERAPFHMPAFRNDHVLMVNVFLPAGRTAPYHEHRRDFAYVLVRESGLLVQNLGDPAPTPIHWPRGAVGFGEFSKKPLVHMAMNTGSDPIRMVGFELLTPAPNGFELSERPAAYEPIMDNARVRGWRAVVKPGEAVPAFVQKAPGVRIVVEGGEIVETVDGGAEQNLALQPGDFQWREAGARRAIRNAGATVAHFVEFELR